MGWGRGWFPSGSSLALFAVLTLVGRAAAEDSPAGYRLLRSVPCPSTGGGAFAFIDGRDRQLYLPRGSEIVALDLADFRMTGSISGVRASGGAIDPPSGHGFTCSRPLLVWDLKLLEITQSVEVRGRPTAICLDPSAQRIFLLSAIAPGITALNAGDGKIVGTLNLPNPPAHAVADGHGRIFVDSAETNSVAVIDGTALRATATLPLGNSQGGLGLDFDPKAGRLFCFRRAPSACVVVRAADGVIIANVPLNPALLGGGFNPATSVAFAWHADGTLVLIRETAAGGFEVAQTLALNVPVKAAAVDPDKDQYLLLTATKPAVPGGPAGESAAILVVGK